MQPHSVHSHLVYGGFQAAVAELSGHDREYVVPKTRTIYCLAPYIKSLLIAAAATAKLLQSCLTLCDPIDSSPPGSPIPGILKAKTLEWVAISFSNAWKWKVKVKSLSRVWLLATPWTVAYQAPPSMGFSRQEHWSSLPLPSPWWLLEYIKCLWTPGVINICAGIGKGPHLSIGTRRNWSVWIQKPLRMRILGRWGTRKHQESVSPPRQQLHWQNLSDVTITELWNQWKYCTFLQKTGEVTGGDFQFFSW